MYRTVFDISQVKPDYSLVYGLAGLALLGLAILLFRIVVSSLVQGGFDRRSTLIAGVGLAVLSPPILLVALISTQSGLAASRSALSTGHTMVVDGLVENFHAQPPDGHYPQTFMVGGVAFSYSDFVNDPCYHTTASSGSPVGPNAHVRLHYYPRSSGECIVRVEIR